MRHAKVVTIVLLLIAGLGLAWFLWQGMDRLERIVIDTDRTIEGDFAVASTQRVVLAKGAKLTVTGNMSVEGELVCEQGAIQAVIAGELRVRNTISCPDPLQETGIAIVAKTFTFDKTSSVISAGSIQLVDRADKVLVADRLEQAYEQAATNTGTGLRVGPLQAGNGTQSSLGSASVAYVSPTRLADVIPAVFGMKSAQAQSTPVSTISGDWQIIGEGQLPYFDIEVVPADKKIKHILLNFDFSDGNALALQDFNLTGPAGFAGADAVGVCNALGENGQDAMRMNVQATNVRINNVKLTLGSGGNGGKAETPEDCDPAFATGGNGGKPGNVKITATRDFQITGAFEIIPGKGGNGGEAQAYGKDPQANCPGDAGGNATAKGGNGGDSLQNLGTTGSIGGLANVTIREVEPSQGGNAIADGGYGSVGDACGCVGGAGGKATATGGQGGKTKTAIGKGGDAGAIGGDGGNGGSCGPDKKGGAGGVGGTAMATPGMSGSIIAEDSGMGGTGGDGCIQGMGGAGGAGRQPGEKGKDGKNICPAKKIKVIQYQGKYIPIDQIRLAGPDACSESHWHGGPVTATDGTKLSDPNPGACGFCAQSACPVIEIEVPDLQAQINFRL